MNTIGNNLFNFNNSMFGNNSGGSNMLGDYMSIKNGSYKKLLTAYYAKNGKDSTDGSSTDNKTDSTTKDSKQLLQVKSDADALSDAANTLKQRGKDSLFNEITKTVTDEETGVETTIKDYDRDAIYSAVKKFTESYNDILKSAGDQDDVLILKKAAMMTADMKANKSLLKDIGITIGKDNKLSIDEEKFKVADMSNVKTLFEGNNSFAAKMGKKGMDISAVAKQQIADAKRGYGKTGGYVSPISTGTLYDSFL